MDWPHFVSQPLLSSQNNAYYESRTVSRCNTYLNSVPVQFQNSSRNHRVPDTSLSFCSVNILKNTGTRALILSTSSIHVSKLDCKTVLSASFYPLLSIDSRISPWIHWCLKFLGLIRSSVCAIWCNCRMRQTYLQHCLPPRKQGSISGPSSRGSICYRYGDGLWKVVIYLDHHSEA